MNFIKFTLLSIACLFCVHEGISACADPLDFSESNIAPIAMEQVVITEEGLFIIDDLTNTLIPVVGFIQHGNQAFAVNDIRLTNSAYIGYVKCQHKGYACTKCFGCFDSECWNRCKCKKK